MRFVAGWYGMHTGGNSDYLLQEKRARIAAESIAKEQSGES